MSTAKKQKYDPVFLVAPGCIMAVKTTSTNSGEIGNATFEVNYCGDFEIGDKDCARMAFAVAHVRDAFALLKILTEVDLNISGKALKKTAQRILRKMDRNREVFYGQ